jgi:hypothetical protein
MFLDKRISLRLKRDVYRDIVSIYKYNKDRYDSVGHFIRAAINESIRKHKRGVNDERSN